MKRRRPSVEPVPGIPDAFRRSWARVLRAVNPPLDPAEVERVIEETWRDENEVVS